ncbi:MAG TPA: LuxR C-terminal-related transcriptional regulator [Streptosporangiaceae bacterium]|nr:LuxR C-terminal-related transcriptional regulator [Streptosporangiaceae bacterium]
MPEVATTGHGSSRGTRFALTKFRPPPLPGTLITRSGLHERLAAGSGQRLTVVVGSAGAGKSVLLADWAAARPAGTTSWLSCDRADTDPVRFWAGFIEAPRAVEPGFGADAADLLAMDRKMSADVTASLANDAAKLPAGSAIIVDDFHVAASAVAPDMTDLIERWPSDIVQLVLAGRFDPPLRQHRLRMSGQLTEVRDRDLYFSLAESRDLLANFGVQLSDADLALLHQRSEGWPAVLQMAALSLRGTTDPERLERVLEVRGQAIAEYFISEVLDQQPAEVAGFMLDTSVLDVLTVEACTAVTGRPDVAALLRAIDTAHLFLVALDDEWTSFRYHQLVRRVLRAELRARDRARERALQLRAAEWFEVTGDPRRAAYHYLAAREPDRALALLQDRVVPDFLHVPARPAPLVLSPADSSLLAQTPERLMGLAADLLLSGDTARGAAYLDLLGQSGQIPAESRLAARLAAFQSFRYGVAGQLERSVQAALDARAIQQRTQLTDEWNSVVTLVLVRVYNCLEDRQAAGREAAAALAEPDVAEPVRLVMVPGARALAWFEDGRLPEAAEAAEAADAGARRLGFSQHFFSVDHLRALAGLALERRDLDTAERLTERVLSITEQRRPLFEFLALLDRARIWAARGQVRDALASVATARQVLTGGSPALLAQADEQEALLRLSLGDLGTPAELAARVPAAARRGLLLARIALAAGGLKAVTEHLQAAALGDLTPRQALVRQVLLAAAAIERGDSAAASILGGVLHTARGQGFLNTVIATAPQVAGYVIEHAAQLRSDPFVERLVAAALEVRAAQPVVSSSRALAEPLTAAELRILTLLPTSTYLQIADTLYVSRNTVKTHLRSIYSKLGVASRSAALERAVDLRLLLVVSGPTLGTAESPSVG